MSGSKFQRDAGLDNAAHLETLVERVMSRRMARREFVREALAVGLSLSGIALILEACGATLPSQAPGASAASGGATGLAASGPASSAPPASPRAGGVLRVAMSGDPNGLDPALAGVGFSHLIIEQVYSTLLSLDADDNPQPDLASAYEQSPDGLTYTFHLRPNVTFHNGKPLTADDVQFTFDRLKDPKTGYPFIDKVQTIDHIDVVDPSTVRFVLTAPTAPFLVALAFPGSAIVPKSEVQARGDLSAAPVGSGPFVFDSYQPGTLLTLKRNPTYYEPGRPYLDGLEYHIIQEGTERTNALLGGVVDFSSDVDPKDWAQVSTASNVVGESISGGHWHWIMLNNKIKPFDNPLVRRAVAFAIDRQAIIDSVFFGQADPITGGVIPSWSWAYDAAADIFPATADPAKAMDFLSQAGYPTGLDAPIVLDASIPAFSAQGPLLQAQLGAAGIRTTLSLVPDPKYCNDVFVDHNFTISNQAWLSPLADPDDFITPNYQSNNPNNAQSYSSAKMDDLIAKSKSALDQSLRKTLYANIEDLANQDVPFVPTLNARILMAHTASLKGFVLPRSGFLKTLRDSWLAT